MPGKGVIGMAYISPIGDAALMAVSVRESDGSVNYTQVFNNGFTIVYLRASSGADYTDCRLGTNYTAAVKAGLSVGFYHYLTARTVEEARSQAEFFIRSIGSRTTVLRTALQFDRFRRNVITAICNQFADVLSLCMSQGLCNCFRPGLRPGLQIHKL